MNARTQARNLIVQGLKNLSTRELHELAATVHRRRDPAPETDTDHAVAVLLSNALTWTEPQIWEALEAAKRAHPSAADPANVLHFPT